MGSFWRGLAIFGQYALPFLFVIAGLMSGSRAGKDAGREARLPQVDTSRWSLDLLKALDWKRFELVCAGYFEELGFRAKTARGGREGGCRRDHQHVHGGCEVIRDVEGDSPHRRGGPRPEAA